MTSSLFTRVCFIVAFTGSVQPGVGSAEILASHSFDSDAEPDAVLRRLQGKYLHQVDNDKADDKQMTSSSEAAPQRKHGPCVTHSEKEMDRETRKWGENSMSAWGKRVGTDDVDDGFLVPNRVECNEQTDNEDEFPVKGSPVQNKRKWGENTMQVWGKRSEIQQDASTEKRKWGEKTMSAWGKRNADTADDATNAVEKRKSWGSNTMQVWGKRTKPRHGGIHLTSSGSSDLDDLLEFSSEPAANSVHSSKTLHPGSSMTSSIGGDSARPAGGYWGPKRKWETNVMKVWGKRTASQRQRTVPASVGNDERVGNDD